MSNMVVSKDVEKSRKGVMSGLPAEERQTMHPLLWYCILAVGVLSYGSYSILVHLSFENGQVPYSSSMVYFITEGIKLFFCMANLLPDLLSGQLTGLNWTNLLPYLIPAILYTSNNNLAVRIQPEMDPATYQILGNLKIITSALLYRLIMKREISHTQWVSLALLFIGGVANCLGSLQADSKSDTHMHLTSLGLAMVLIYCTVSGLAGVSTEYYFKDKMQVSIHIQNGALYVFMMMFNGLSIVGQEVHSAMITDIAKPHSVLEGFNIYTWLLIATQVVSGLTMSIILKYGNNIIRLFVIQSAILVTTILSVILFGLKLNVYFFLSFVLVLVALAIYFNVITCTQPVKKWFGKSSDSSG